MTRKPVVSWAEKNWMPYRNCILLIGALYDSSIFLKVEQYFLLEHAETPEEHPTEGEEEGEGGERDLLQNADKVIEQLKFKSSLWIEDE